MCGYRKNLWACLEGSCLQLPRIPQSRPNCPLPRFRAWQATPLQRLEKLPPSVAERKLQAGAVSIGHRDGDRRRACDELACAIDPAVGSTSRTNRGENLAK